MPKDNGRGKKIALGRTFQANELLKQIENTTIGGLISRIQTLENDYTAMQNSISSISESMTNIQQSIQSLNQALTALTDRVTILETP